MSTLVEKKEIYNSLNELTGLVQCLMDKNVLIDLQNETSVAGRIINVDGYMNIVMEKVVFIDQLGKQFPMDNFMIYPKYIRYIHVPQGEKLIHAFEERAKSITTKGCRKESKKRTYKEIRAKKNHVQALADNQML